MDRDAVIAVPQLAEKKFVSNVFESSVHADVKYEIYTSFDILELSAVPIH